MLERNNAKNGDVQPVPGNKATPAVPENKAASPPNVEPTKVSEPAIMANASSGMSKPDQVMQASNAPTATQESQAAEKVAESAGADTLLRFSKKKTVHHSLAPFKVDTTAVRLCISSSRPRTLYKYDIKVYRIRDKQRVAVNLSKEEAMQAMILLRNNPTAQQLMKGSFWYDFKSLFYSKYSFEKTTFSITMSDKQYELDILPTESMTITDEQSIDERATQALMTLIMYETSVDKYLRMLGSTLGSCSA